MSIEIAVDLNLKWPEDVLLATVVLKGLLSTSEDMHVAVGHFGVGRHSTEGP